MTRNAGSGSIQSLPRHLHRVAAVKAGSLAALALALAACAHSPANSLEEGFASPPAEARPYVWWHWMNGNVTAEGAEKDLRWMKAAGIGGVQLFEGNLASPRVVEPALIWSSPGWEEAVAHSAAVAQELDLELAIASSPGWSATGAPFVEPADAMKKLVWSQVHVEGGTPVGRLPAPPRVAGPFQDISAADHGEPQRFYRDVRVLAFPSIDNPPSAKLAIDGPGGQIDAALLTDRRHSIAATVPIDSDGNATLTFDFGEPTRIASLELGLPAPTGFGAPPTPQALLSVSVDGVEYRPLADLPGNTVGVRSVTFAPETVRYARIELSQPAGGAPPVAPGSIGIPAGTAPSTLSVSEARFAAVPAVNRWIEKAGFATASDYYASPTPGAGDDAAVPADMVVDVTEFLEADSSLSWTPPAGQWTILRLGYSLTGKTNGPAPAEATGLEVDKLDPAAVESYITRYLAIYRDAVGDDLIGEEGIRALLSDSIEAGNQNWTPRLIAEFRRLRGYDPTPFLPALTGVVVESAQASDQFLYDFRKTIADLLSEAHYGTLARVAHANGLRYYAEALEDQRPQLGDDLAIRAHADVPMGAFWWSPDGRLQRPTLAADIQGAASVANVYGRDFVGAESLTAFGRPFAFAPADLKPSADHAFALGVNRIIIHTSAHQPLDDAKPGFSLAPQLGQYFTRHETWAEMASGWTDYLARVSWLMQQGVHAADIAYFVGEEAPVTGLYGDRAFDGVPAGYGFDFVGEEGLRLAMRVSSDGALVSDGGVRYRLLMLGGSSERMTLPTLERVHSLVRQGVVVVGGRPSGTPSLSDDAGRWEELADDLWPAAGAGSHRLGAGAVFENLEDALRETATTPDWLALADADLVVQHRALEDNEVYFIFNRAGQPYLGDISLRGDGYHPELWDAVTGRREALSYQSRNGRTIVPLQLAVGGSAIVVLHRDAGKASSAALPMLVREEVDLSEDWQLQFARSDETIDLPQLVSWTSFSQPELEYFSGTASYRREFVMEPDKLTEGGRIELDLGSVGDVAEVIINDQTIGTVWTTPYAIDITPQVVAGSNSVEIRVANLWVNRLVGDAVLGEENATAFGPTYTAAAPLRPSGLLGPVALRILEAPR